MNKWVKVVDLIKSNGQAVIYFVYADIFTHFGVHREIVTEGGPQFVSRKMEALFQKYRIQHRVTSPYHP